MPDATTLDCDLRFDPEPECSCPGPPMVRALCGHPLSYAGWGVTAEELAFLAASVRSLRDAGSPDGEIVATTMALIGQAATEDTPAVCAENHAAVFRRLVVVLLGFLPAARGDGAG